MIYILSIIIIFLVLLLFYFSYTSDPKIIFLSRDRLIEYLKLDNDRFYKKLNKIDLNVRNIKTIEEYYKIIEKSIDDINVDYKNLLLTCIDRSNKFLLEIKEPYFDNIKCYNIPWKIGTMIGKKYENGMPHTRDDIIILPKYTDDNDDFLTKLLIHEKIHIYQRFYPKLCNIYITNLGFKKHKKVEPSDKIRANPDIDDWVYTDANGLIYKSVFKKDAKKITDVHFFPINKSRYEHPFEKMANEISDKYSTKN
jgi:hypothetical protein